MALKKQNIPEYQSFETFNFIPDFVKGRLSDVSTILQFVEKSQYDEIPKVIRNWSDFSLPGDYIAFLEMGDHLTKSAQIRNPQKCYAILEKINSFLSEKERSFIE